MLRDLAEVNWIVLNFSTPVIYLSNFVIMNVLYRK